MIDNLGIRPLSDRIVVKRLDERTTEGGIFIPETVGDKSQRGTVVAIGPGKYEDGKIHKLSIKCNDKVIFGKYAGTEVTIKGIDYLVMKEDDVIAIID